MQAIWKPVEGYENFYSVSSHGEVRREKSLGRREQKILKQYKDRKGYMYISLSIKNIKQTIRVHRIVAAAFLGPLGTLTVNHIDLDKSNNSLSNLELMTGAENTRHAIDNGHKSLSNAKITETDALAIRVAKSMGQSSAALADAFGLSKRTIDRIFREELWKPRPDQRENP